MSDILRLALHARLPLLTARTDDVINVEAMLSYLTDREVVRWDGRRIKQDTVYWALPDDAAIDKVTSDSYEKMLAVQSSVVLFNPEPGRFPFARDCGLLEPAVEYLVTSIGGEDGLLPADQAEALGPYFAGMSLTTTIEVILLTQARDGAATPNGISQTKAWLGQSTTGIQIIDTADVSYSPPPWLSHWLDNDAKLLGNAKYRELWPKGFLLHGPPGTGKTEAARYIANQLGLPLFMVDVGSMLSRWQGESEANLRRVLAFIDGQNASVVLWDETDKLFSTDGGNASSANLTAMLLWWLQGRSNKAVSIMTANAIDCIPAALYRPGRLDAVHEMLGICDRCERQYFMEGIAESLADRYGLSFPKLYDAAADIIKPLGYPVTQAMIVNTMRSMATQMIASSKEGKTK